MSTESSVSLVESFGIVVRQLRERKQWSQEQLAARSNLNRSYLGEVERGRVIASLVTAQKLAQALDIGIAGLLAECEQHSQDRSDRLVNLVAIDG
ncbi:hypothetical protein BH09PSE5_BH09PSE5_13210 [soil metagenome]